MYADDLVLMSENTERLRSKIRKWKEALNSNLLKDNPEIARVTACIEEVGWSSLKNGTRVQG